MQPIKKKLSLHIVVTKIKNMKTIKFTFIIFFLIPIIGFSNKVSVKVAENVAKNFFYEHSNLNKSFIKFSDVIINNETDENFFYVFNLTNDNGFIIISAEDAYFPVVGYSLNNKYSSVNQPINISSWMNRYVQQVKYLRKNNIKADNEISGLWNKYNVPTSSFYKNTNSKAIVVDALTGDITWNQSPGWNEYCPAGTPTGCVATAMSIIMKYYQYPIHGSGSSSYNDYGRWSGYSTGTHSANYGDATYFWNLMPKNASSKFAAQLCYHAGISVEMDYAAEGSGSSSYDVPDALRNYFNYTCTNYTSKYSNETSWKNALKAQLDDSKPMYYSGRDDDNGGHAFVCDGYDDTDNFHFNFGWGGSNNGFYSISDVGGFHNGQGAIMNIVPADNSILNAPENVVATLIPVNENDFNVDLTWDAPETKDIATFKIFRDFDQIAEVSSSTFNYTDVAPLAGNYYYSVVAKYTNTKESLATSDYIQASFNVIFHAKDPNTNNEVFTANVSFNDEDKPITFVGASFSGVAYGVKEYTITHTDYPTTSGSVVVNSDRTVNVILNGIYTDVSKLTTKKNEFEIFPNPSNGILNVVCSELIETASYKIINVTGKLVLKGTINSDRTQINLQNIDKGFYIIKIFNSNIYTKSFIIKVIHTNHNPSSIKFWFRPFK